MKLKNVHPGVSVVLRRKRDSFWPPGEGRFDGRDLRRSKNRTPEVGRKQGAAPAAVVTVRSPSSKFGASASLSESSLISSLVPRGLRLARHNSTARWPQDTDLRTKPLLAVQQCVSFIIPRPPQAGSGTIIVALSRPLVQ